MSSRAPKGSLMVLRRWQAVDQAPTAPAPASAGSIQHCCKVVGSGTSQTWGRSAHPSLMRAGARAAATTCAQRTRVG